jgi:hypothetical protein
MSLNEFEADSPRLAELISYFNRKTVENEFELFDKLEIDSKIQESIKNQITGEFQYWASAAFVDSSFESFEGPNSKMCQPSDFWPILGNSMLETSLVVDLGSGVRPNFFLGQDVTICVELFQDYLEHLKNSSTNNNVILVKEDVLSFLLRQPSRSIETIVVTDLIEHLSKEDGSKLIDEVKRVVTKQALIVTPRGFMPQHVGEGDDDDWGFIGNELQNHISGWDIEDFQGWDILLSPGYYSDGIHPEGVLGAIFKQEVRTGQGLLFVLEPHNSSQESLKNESLFFEYLTVNDALDSNIAIRYILPLAKSVKSNNINLMNKLPVGEIYFASFNYDVNNALGSRILDCVGSFPGTAHFYLQKFKEDKVIVVQTDNPSGINYNEFVEEGKLHYFTLNSEGLSDLPIIWSNWANG